VSGKNNLVLIVCGGRDYEDRDQVYLFLDYIDYMRVIKTIIQGGATGADKLAKEWAESRGKKCIEERALWGYLEEKGAVIRTRSDGTQYNAKAGYDRNLRMLTKHNPDGTVAFPGGRGTADMIKQTIEFGKPVMTLETIPWLRSKKNTNRIIGG
jgi:hypothetical protein